MRRLGFLLVLAAATAVTAGAQDLVKEFQNARLRRVASELADRRGHVLEARPVAHIPVRSDTLEAWLATMRPVPDRVPEPPAPEPFVIDSVRAFSKLERVVFSNRFGSLPWAFQQGSRLARIDTTATTDIRARLQARYGSPTMTLAELDSVEGRVAEELIQFEYWLLVNDSIPAMIIDVNGPLGRGVVVSTPSEWRTELDGIRHALLQPLFADPRRAPYVDYYYQAQTGTWFVSGYDGASFFHQRIDAPGVPLTRPTLSAYVLQDDDR